MKQVFKYKLTSEVQTIDLPEDAEALTVRYQSSIHGNGLMLWAFVDPHRKTKPVTFVTLVTGQGMSNPAKYVATVESPEGEILHVFQLL